MKRTINLASAILMVAGIGILAYVGITFANTRSAASPHWNSSQQRKGQEIAQRLTHAQTISLPQRLQHTVLPPAGSEPPLRLVIPKIGVDAPVVQSQPVNGVWNVPDWTVGHLATTPNPGGAGNMALSAHDDIKGELFKRVGELSPGDAIVLYTSHARYTYVVVRQQTVDPSNVSVLNPTPNATVTLVSCVPYWVDTQRLIIQGVLKSRSAA